MKHYVLYAHESEGTLRERAHEQPNFSSVTSQHPYRSTSSLSFNEWEQITT